MAGHPGEHLPPGTRREEGSHIAGAQDCVEPFGDTARGQVEFGEVAHEPGGPGVVLFGGGDELRITIDPDDLMAGLSKVAAVPAGSTTGIQYPGTSWDEGVDQPGFAHQIRAGSGHIAETLHIPRGVFGALPGHQGPLVGFSHTPILPRPAGWGRLRQARRTIRCRVSAAPWSPRRRTGTCRPYRGGWRRAVVGPGVLRRHPASRRPPHWGSRRRCRSGFGSPRGP